MVAETNKILYCRRTDHRTGVRRRHVPPQPAGPTKVVGATPAAIYIRGHLTSQHNSGACLKVVQRGR